MMSVFGLFAVVNLSGLAWAQSNDQGTTDGGTEIFAQVGDTTITEQAFAEALVRATRQRYYHGNPPESETQAFRREVAEDVVRRALLIQEATRRGFEADHAKIQSTLEQYEVRYAQSARWQSEGARLLPALRTRLEEDDLLKQLELHTRRVEEPSEAELRAFHRAYPEKFTEPARERLSLILLGVAPSSPANVWQAARREAAALVAQLRNGADFAELAQLRSSDASAANGGDMGYLHQGMLGVQAEQMITRLSTGDITDPIMVLEGMAIFRLEERLPARTVSYTRVRDRVRDLSMRERADKAWQTLVERLRSTTPIKLRDPTLLPSPPAA